MTTRLFYAILCNNEFVRFVPKDLTSAYEDTVILDVAPSSATMFNDFVTVLHVHSICEEQYPDEKFCIKPFSY